MGNGKILLLEEVCAIVEEYVKYWKSDANDLTLLNAMISKNQDIWNRKNMNGHLTAASILFNKDSSKVLLVDHLFTKKKLVPGGHCDRNELPVEAARRELFEEVGVSCKSLHEWHLCHNFPIDIDIHLVPENIKKNEDAHFHFDFRYLFQLDCDVDFVVQEEEVGRASFLAIKCLEIEYPRVYERILREGIIDD